MPFETIEQGLAALRAAAQRECRVEENALYLPLLGKRFASSEADATDLETSVRDFTADENHKRVCALLGDGGSGKSVFLQQFTLKLWSEYVPGKPIPLFISLPLLMDPIHSAVEETLKKAGFNEAQLETLKTDHSFVFIFDGYDEIHQLQNLYVSNRLSDWSAKTIISCRSQYLYNKENPNLYFMPLQGEREQPHLLQTLYVAPFSETQIESYFTAMRDRGMVIPSYEEITHIPGLQDLITSPFLLKLTVEALPEILARYFTTSESLEERHRLTQTDLYKSFISCWFERQEQKLKDSGQIMADMPDQKPIFWRYCQALALEMHKHNLSWLNADDERFSVYFESDTETERLRSACPIKKTGEKIGFWHQSLGMYFVAQTIYQESFVEVATTSQSILADSINTELSSPISVEQERPQGSIHLRLITDDPSALRNLADEVDRDERYKAWLFELIERSKTNKHYAVGAANAISALNIARVSFSEMNFDGICIPEANLTKMIAFKTRFCGADLARCTLQNAYLAEACFDHADLQDVQWGEMPGLYWPPGSVTGLLFTPDDKYLIVSGDPHTMTIYDLTTGHDIASHSTVSRIVDINIAPDGSCIAIGCANGRVELYYIRNQIASTIAPGQEFEYLKHHPMAFHPNGKKIIFGNGDALVEMEFSSSMFMPTPKEIMPLRKAEKIQWSNDGKILGILHEQTRIMRAKLIAFGDSRTKKLSAPKNIQLWNMQKQEKFSTLEGYDFCLSPDGKFAVVVQLQSSGKDLLEVYSLPDAMLVKKMELPQTTDLLQYSMRGTSLQLKIMVDKSGQVILATGHDGLILLWELSSLIVTPIARLNGHRAPISTLAFSHDRQNCLLASGTGRLELEGGGGDRRIRLWDINRYLSKQNEQTKTHYGSIRAMFMGSQQKIISVSEDGAIMQWSAKDGQYYSAIEGLLPESNMCFFQEKLYFLNQEGQLRQFCLKTKEMKLIPLIAFQLQSDRIRRTSLAISSEGTRLAVSDQLGETQVFSLETLQLLYSYKAEGVFYISFSPDATSQYLFIFGNNICNYSASSVAHQLC